jgi:hypothetical protein
MRSSLQQPKSNVRSATRAVGSRPRPPKAVLYRQEPNSSLHEASECATTSRRSTLLHGGAALAAAAAAAPAAFARAVLAAEPLPSAAAAGESFYSLWPYMQPSDILPFVRERARQGDAQAVLDALDEWAT